MITFNDLQARADNVIDAINRNGVTPSTRRECWMFAAAAKRAAPSQSGKFATLENLKTEWPASWVKPDGKPSFAHLIYHIEGVMREVRETIEGQPVQ